MLIIILLLLSGVNATELPDEKFTNIECINCHEKSNPNLVKDWQTSVHAYIEEKADCITCHGNQHRQATISGQHDQICINCHGGEKSPVVRSYNTSKHGVLMRLEQYDKNQALADHRVPGCSYCHMYAGNHNVNNTELKKVQSKLRIVCQNCHSSRYITRLFSNGESQIKIARMKIREANKLIKQASKQFSNTELADVKHQMEKMQQHLENIYLGVSHQSPSYQWWHGQPALDGDLLRIKNAIGELYRME